MYLIQFEQTLVAYQLLMSTTKHGEVSEKTWQNKLQTADILARKALNNQTAKLRLQNFENFLIETVLSF